VLWSESVYEVQAEHSWYSIRISVRTISC